MRKKLEKKRKKKMMVWDNHELKGKIEKIGKMKESIGGDKPPRIG